MLDVAVHKLPNTYHPVLTAAWNIFFVCAISMAYLCVQEDMPSGGPVFEIKMSQNSLI